MIWFNTIKKWVFNLSIANFQSKWLTEIYLMVRSKFLVEIDRSLDSNNNTDQKPDTQQGTIFIFWFKYIFLL